MSTQKSDLEKSKANLEEIETKKADAKALEVRSSELLSLIDEKKKLYEEIAGLTVELKETIAEIDNQKASIVDSLKNIQDANKDLTDTLMNLGQELSRVEERITKLAMQRENTINRLWDEYELTYSTASEIRKEFEDEKAAFKRSGELKSQIKALGNVNMEAIEEYKEKKERF